MAKLESNAEGKQPRREIRDAIDAIGETWTFWGTGASGSATQKIIYDFPKLQLTIRKLAHSLPHTSCRAPKISCMSA